VLQPALPSTQWPSTAVQWCAWLFLEQALHHRRLCSSSHSHSNRQRMLGQKRCMLRGTTGAPGHSSMGGIIWWPGVETEACSSAGAGQLHGTCEP